VNVVVEATEIIIAASSVQEGTTDADHEKLNGG
jgi:hypothetical protein